MGLSYKPAEKRRIRVAVDTNMLTAMLEFRIDVFEEIRRKLGKVEFLITGHTIEELAKIAEKGGKEARKAMFALRLLRKKDWRLVKVPVKHCDDALVMLSSEAIIATNDRALRKEIKTGGGRVLLIKQKKFIEFDG
jgi:rRNA-processing protein FCF1